MAWLDFNPRTHKECDPLNGKYFTQHDIFQSTHSQRVRLWQVVAFYHFREISIHALTKSATTLGSLALSLKKLFQSTHSQRVRQTFPAWLGLAWVFQSTHSQRVRPQLQLHDSLIHTISIHALTKSATQNLVLFVHLCFISIHALTKSATKTTLLVLVTT